MSGKVLEAEVTLPELADRGDIFKRALLLFFVRPDLDRLAAATNSWPGPAVLSVAAFLQATPWA